MTNFLNIFERELRNEAEMHDVVARVALVDAEPLKQRANILSELADVIVRVRGKIDEQTES